MPTADTGLTVIFIGGVYTIDVPLDTITLYHVGTDVVVNCDVVCVFLLFVEFAVVGLYATLKFVVFCHKNDVPVEPVNVSTAC